MDDQWCVVYVCIHVKRHVCAAKSRRRKEKTIYHRKKISLEPEQGDSLHVFVYLLMLYSLWVQKFPFFALSITGSLPRPLLPHQWMGPLLGASQHSKGILAGEGMQTIPTRLPQLSIYSSERKKGTVRAVRSFQCSDITLPSRTCCDCKAGISGADGVGGQDPILSENRWAATHTFQNQHTHWSLREEALAHG